VGLAAVKHSQQNFEQYHSPMNLDVDPALFEKFVLRDGIPRQAANQVGASS
jgi:hypothetical protein